MIPVLLLISSPVWVYYGVHFLPNIWPSAAVLQAGSTFFVGETPSKMADHLAGALPVRCLAEDLRWHGLLTAGIFFLQERKEAWWKQGVVCSGGLVTHYVAGNMDHVRCMV